MRLVMFDIDGTLTQTVQADDACFVRALADVFAFRDVVPDWSTYRHCSDSGILAELFLRRTGRALLAIELATFQAYFLSLLTAAIEAQPFSAVDGAAAMLTHLSDHSKFAVSLASGAWEASARLKLASAGLHLPETPGAFADTAPAREDIMRASFASAARTQARESFDGVTYIGDGVWDARASRNLGYRFIGIARDPAKAERLYAEGASHVFENYLDADAFLAALHDC
ncbi:Haloacid dehalogenase domain protein hydrolase [Chthoniobacter flavus Ellin428]|uniref:Haloacid dehalogenase domain protein hydrolase n=1 Tax=Chthoniobacter flavus Ellin428 TaxID=497964 RepID=B4D874_9BACT|nr:HAD family hydrolase [Chthoniobacter flavus]EDY17428.1 Haloacid dehalogenase domain protein hydrolase [Chthoniobacter flavus Ellin428]TCO87326.1 phosphoglycolate phosphatase-like HAD superfamily hydrolase [Chthoniobacter flavus]